MKNYMNHFNALAVLFAFGFFTAVPASSDVDMDTDRAEIESILNDNYLNGFYLKLDADLVRSVFNSEMRLAVNMGDQVDYMPLEDWMAYEGVGTAPEDLTEVQKAKSTAELKIISIDIAGSTAHAKGQVFVNQQLLYTNFYGLYKLAGKWQVANKLFEQHQH
tara:strand:+ start:2020 stop:2505 length:486 start_codon:yes stop_codon:yes gene_type:complete